jgi:uncharacterized surface protein with fasciclin (FAS1) repeats
MKKHAQQIMMAVFAAVLICFSGCTDHQERYEDPPWLGGASIEILQERGNYNTFLALMDKANYTEPISKQLFTLFVPDDQAFADYFQSIGVASVDDLTEEQARNLFTLHVLRNPRSRFQLIYEYAWSELQGPTGEYASLFHRKPTPSTSIPYIETIRYLPGRVGEEVIIYTGEKNIPLFTAEWFDDFGGAEDGSDYLFMYPGSKWEEGYPDHLKGMNWHNAMVIPNPEIPDELEVRTASGFIYFLDRVVPLMPSIEEYLIANQDRFGVYYDILQRFAVYGNTRVDEQRRVQYRKSYDLVFNLAEERGPSTNTAVPPQNMWTAFIPSDAVLQNYLDNTVLKYYSSLDSVPRVTLYYILQTQLSATVALPSKIEGTYFNAFGDPTDMGKSDIVSSYMCSNGLVYETNKVMEPNVFTCVPGTLFFDKNYTTLLFVLEKANMLTSLANPDADVTLFATTNEKLEEYGIRYNATRDVVESRGPVDGVWRNMNTTELVMFAQDQIYDGLLGDLSGEGGYAEMASGNYIRFGNNQVMGAENQAFNRPSNVEEVVVNERNGHLVKVDYPVVSRFVMGKLLSNGHNIAEGPADPEISEFAQLLVDANLLDARFRDAITREVIPNLKFLAANKYWTAFIPTNEAMAKARAEGIIPVEYPPASDRDARTAIDNFIKYHFIQGSVVFDDGMKSGAFDTHYSYRDPDDNTKIVNEKVMVINSPENMAVEDVSGQVVSIDHADANKLVRKGVVHKINTVLNYQK